MGLKIKVNGVFISTLISFVIIDVNQEIASLGFSKGNEFKTCFSSLKIFLNMSFEQGVEV